MKKVVALLLLLSLFGTLFPSVMQAAAVPSLYLNGAPITTDSQPRIVNDSTMVPIRVVAEELGYSVTWMQAEKQVDIRSDATRVLLTIDAAEAEVNGEAKTLGTPAYVDVDVTYVPLRFVGESLGIEVYWDQPTRSVHLYREDPPEEPEEQAGEDAAEGEAPDGSGEEAVLPPVPADALAVVKSVGFNGFSRITVRYDGELMAQEPFWSDTKLVIDMPYASLDPAIMADLAKRKVSQGELIIDTKTLQKVRYSYYSNSPSTVRIVFDLMIKQEFAVSYGEQEYYVDFLLTDPPELPEQPPAAADTFKVVIDAGHGGKDPGAPSVNGRWEKEFNLAVARKVNAILEQEDGITPYMTRNTDVFVELADRAAFANNLNADIFVSIHANRYTPSIRGAETYYKRPDSAELASTLHKHLVKGTGLPDRGVRTANFLVIRETTMPAVLLECGYLSNTHDAKALFTESVQNRIAQEIAAGIKAYAAAHGGK